MFLRDSFDVAPVSPLLQLLGVFWTVLEDAIMIATTYIFGARPGFVGGLKSIPNVILSYHMMVLPTPISPLSPPPYRYLMVS